MPTQLGSFSSTGSPRLRVRIRGIFKDAEREFDALIDTGYSGFVSMPIVDAFPLGLVLNSTTSLVLADNSKVVRLTAFGTATLENGDSSLGVIVLEWDQGEVLVGMEFLRSLKKTLAVAPLAGTITLTDDALPPPPVVAQIPPAAEEAKHDDDPKAEDQQPAKVAL